MKARDFLNKLTHGSVSISDSDKNTFVDGQYENAVADRRNEIVAEIKNDGHESIDYSGLYAAAEDYKQLSDSYERFRGEYISALHHEIEYNAQYSSNINRFNDAVADTLKKIIRSDENIDKASIEAEIRYNLFYMPPWSRIGLEEKRQIAQKIASLQESLMRELYERIKA